MANRLEASNSPWALAAKVCAIQGLQDALTSKMDDSAFEFALLAVCILANNEIDGLTMEENHSQAPLQLEPLLPPPRELRVYGQLGSMPTHSVAAAMMVHKKGGLEHIKLPGLAEKLAYADLLHASKHGLRPRFKRYWQVDQLLLRRDTTPGALAPSQHAPGRGFFTSMPAMLPARCLSVMIRLATLNRALSSITVAEGSRDPNKVSRITTTAHALQHDLLKLPNWDMLDQTDRAHGDKAVYTICWLTAVIYSNAVILALPHHPGWHTVMAARLRSCLEEYFAKHPELEQRSFFIWSLHVGALAAFHSPHRAWFEQALWRLLTKAGRKSQAAAERCLNEFLWADSACKHGAAMLWLSMPTPANRSVR